MFISKKNARHGETEAQKRNKFSLTFSLVNNIGFGHFRSIFQLFFLLKEQFFLSTMFFKRDCCLTEVMVFILRTIYIDT